MKQITRETMVYNIWRSAMNSIDFDLSMMHQHDPRERGAVRSLSDRFRNHGGTISPPNTNLFTLPIIDHILDNVVEEVKKENSDD